MNAVEVNFLASLVASLLSVYCNSDRPIYVSRGYFDSGSHHQAIPLCFPVLCFCFVLLSSLCEYTITLPFKKMVFCVVVSCFRRMAVAGQMAGKFLSIIHPFIHVLMDQGSKINVT